MRAWALAVTACFSISMLACGADDTSAGGSGFGASGGKGGSSATGGKGGTGGNGGTGGANGGTGGATGGAGGATGGSGGATGGEGGTTGGSGGVAGATGGSGGVAGATGGSGGSAGGTGGTTGGTGGFGGTTGGTGGTTGGSGGTGGTTGGSGGTGGDTLAPQVAGVVPSVSATGVAPVPAIQVQFSEPMMVSSITANTTDTTCTGSLQISKDDFATCVKMASQPASVTLNDTTFSLTVAAPLASLGNYKVRATTATKDVAGNALSATFTQTSPWTIRYYHTIAIDGVNDFTSAETFATSSTGYTGYVAWDETYLYVGMKGADVASGSASKFFLIYLSGIGGTTTGVPYNTQTPGLPFSALYHARWKANNTFTNALKYAAAWNNANWDFTGDVYQNGDYIEMRILLADMNTPSTLSLHLGFVNEQSGVESTYAGVPSTSYTDGYDKNYTKYLALDLKASTVPSASPVLP